MFRPFAAAAPLLCLLADASASTLPFSAGGEQSAPVVIELLAGQALPPAPTAVPALDMLQPSLFARGDLRPCVTAECGKAVEPARPQQTARLQFESLSNHTIARIPIPAAGWLFGSALVGFVMLANRRKV